MTRPETSRSTAPHANAIVVALLALTCGAACGVACGAGPALAEAPPVIPPALAARADSLVAIETRVRWARVLPESALAKARRDGLPAFLDFYATWCVPCRWMDRAVYADPLLAEAAEGVVMVRVDVDRPEGKAMAARFGVVQYPTLVYVSPQGKETLRWIGPLNLRDTRLNLAQAAVPAARRAEVEAACRARPAESMTQSSGILYFGFRGEVERARALAAAFERRPGPSPAALAPVVLSLAKAEEFAARDERAIDAYRRVTELDPKGAFAWRAWLGLSVLHERHGEAGPALVAANNAVALGPRLPFLDARLARLTLGLPRPVPPPGIED